MSQRRVTLVEMGLRDGLQNESVVLSLATRKKLAKALLRAGAHRIELGAFVKPTKVPQMKDSKKLIQGLFDEVPLKELSGASALVPNTYGMEQALETPLREVAFFTAASETFCQKNIDCSVAESLERLKPVLSLANAHKVKVRGYVSTGFGCPFEGKISDSRVISLVETLLDMGCYEVSLGDTIGVASPWQVEHLLEKLLKRTPAKQIAGHFHDTRGTALANIAKAYDMGVHIFDSSLGGIGGCPYAPGATGNVATEDVVYMFEKSGIDTGLDLKKLVEISKWLGQTMKKDLPSKLSHVPFTKASSIS
jgi:hydroxymethylglutaryl-CoA lyase